MDVATSPPHPRRAFARRAALTAALFCGACGGGGGGEPAPAVTAARATQGAATDGAATVNGEVVVNRPYVAGAAPGDFETAQYRAGPAGAVGASEAYARGAFGTGVRVGVLDSGVNDATGLLGGRLVADPGHAPGGGFDSDVDHGLVVATTIGARIGGAAPFHGVAPEATIVSYDVSQGASLISLSRVASAIGAAAASNTRILNMSFGTANVAGDALDVSDEFMAAAINGARDGLVFVVAAGNGADAQPTTLAALPLYVRDHLRRNGEDDAANPLEGRWLAVAGLDASGDGLASFSNRCGLARSFCLAAPSVDVRAVDTSGGAVLASGTSFATAHVAGALAVLQSMWPQLSTETLAEILLRTADDLGAAGVDPVFGYGALNLARAAAPVGELALPAPGGAPDLDATGAVTASALVSSQAMGGALRRMAADGPALAVVDAYGRGFAIEMAAFAAEARREALLADAFPAWVARRDLEIVAAPGLTLRLAADPDAGPATARALRFEAGSGLVVAVAKEGAPSDVPGVASFAAESAPARAALIDPARIENPFLALAESFSGGGVETRAAGARLGLVALAGEGETGAEVGAVGVTAGLGDAALGLRATFGVVREAGGFLGASGAGVYGFGDSETAFASLSGRVALTGRVALAGAAHVGATRMDGGGALVRGADAVSAAWTLGVSATDAIAKDDALSVTVGEPLTVRSGALAYAAPTIDGGWRAVSGDLVGRAPLDVAFGWRWAPTGRDEVGIAGFLRLREGEDAGAALRWARRF